MHNKTISFLINRIVIIKLIVQGNSSTMTKLEASKATRKRPNIPKLWPFQPYFPQQ